MTEHDCSGPDFSKLAKLAVPAPAVVLPAPSQVPPNITSEFLSLFPGKLQTQKHPVDIPVVSLGSLKGLPQRLTLRCDEVISASVQCDKLHAKHVGQFITFIFTLPNDLE